MIFILRPVVGFLAGFTVGRAWTTGDPVHYVPAAALSTLAAAWLVASFVSDLKKTAP